MPHAEPAPPPPDPMSGSGDAQLDAVVARVARLLAGTDSFARRAQEALAELSRLYTSSAIGVWILDEPGSTLELVAYGAPEDTPPELEEGFQKTFRSVPAGDRSLPGPMVMERGEPTWLRPDDPRLHPELRTWLDERPQIESLFAIPLSSSDGPTVGCAVATFPGRAMPDPTCLTPLLEGIGLVSLAAQNEVLRLQREKRRLYRKAAIGDVAAEVAHEVNNPLQGILGLTELLLSSPGTAEARDDLLLIKAEAQRAAAILGNLLTFASPGHPDPERVDVGAVVAEIGSLKRRPLALAGIEFSVHVRPGTPHALVTPSHLRQVLYNLLSNAREAIEDAGEGGEIRVQIGFEGGFVTVSVQDTGPGIPEEVLGRLFTPFFTTKHEGKGTGLGLHVSERLVELNGGSMAAANWGVPMTQGGERGHGGAMFTVRFRADAQDAPPGPDATLQPDGVLVVDDEPVIASVLARYLGRIGYKVETVHSGSSALGRLDASGAYEALLVDLRMPEMNGMELFRTLERRYPEMTSRVAFMSGDIVSGEIRSFLEAAGRPVLSKPFELGRLDELLEELTGGKEEA